MSWWICEVFGNVYFVGWLHFGKLGEVDKGRCLCRKRSWFGIAGRLQPGADRAGGVREVQARAERVVAVLVQRRRDPGEPFVDLVRERAEREGEWQFQVRADAFLYRMVRRLVFVQVMVAQGRLTVEQVQQALEIQTRLPAGLAPAHGLSLVEVTYNDQQ